MLFSSVFASNSWQSNRKWRCNEVQRNNQIEMAAAGKLFWKPASAGVQPGEQLGKSRFLTACPTSYRLSCQQRIEDGFLAGLRSGPKGEVHPVFVDAAPPEQLPAALLGEGVKPSASSPLPWP